MKWFIKCDICGEKLDGVFVIAYREVSGMVVSRCVCTGECESHLSEWAWEKRVSPGLDYELLEPGE